MKAKLLLAITTLITIFFVPSFAYAADGFNYYNEGNTAIIINCDKSLTGSVTIPEAIDGYTITGIGQNAFRDCTGITEVIIPDTVTMIDWCAFENCTSLENIVYSKNIIEIGGYAFRGCTALKEIIIPDTITAISGSSFEGCSSVEKITLGKNLKNIGENAFDGCVNVKEIYVDTICAEEVEDCFANAGTSTDGTHLFFSDNVTVIPCCFSDENNITTITLGKNITSSSYYWPFDGCRNLKQVYWNAVNAQESSYFRFLETNGDGFNVTIADDVTYLPPQAFEESAIKSVVLGKFLTEIGWSAFDDCRYLKHIYWNSENLQTNVFSDMNVDEGGLEVVFGDLVTVIPERTFEETLNLTSVVLGENIKTISKEAFRECENLKSIDLKNVETICEYAFRDCTAIESIKFGEALKTIEDDAFYCCTNLKTITTNKTAYISGDAFSGCSAIDTVYWNIPSHTDFVSGLFYGLDEIKIIFSDDIKRIPSRIIDNYNLITTVYTTLPDSLEEIGNSAFDNCKFPDGLDIPKNVRHIGSSAFNNSSTSFLKLGEGVITIGTAAFNNLTADSIELNLTNVEKIGSNAFMKCKNIKQLIIAENADCEIETKAFYNCDIKTLTIGKGVKSIDGTSFGYCTELETIYWRAEQIADYDRWSNAFAKIGSNSGGVSVIFEKTAKVVPAYLFYQSEGSSANPLIKQITITNSVTRINTNAFYGITEPINIDFSSIEYLEDYALYYCQIQTGKIDLKNAKHIGSYALPTNITGELSLKNARHIGDYAFYNCTGISCGEISLENAENIGYSAFDGCTMLAIENLIIGQADCIGIYAFRNVPLKGDVVIGAKLIKERAFANTLMQTLTFNTPSVFIDQSAFIKNSALTSIIFNARALYISFYAFEDCNSLVSVDLNSASAIIGSYTFRNCNNLTYLTDTNGIRNVGDYAFQNLEKLGGVYLPNVEYIGHYAFSDTAITHLTISPKTKYIGTNAFSWSKLGAGATLYPGTEYGTHPFYGVSSSHNVAENIPGTQISLSGDTVGTVGDLLVLSTDVLPYNATNKIVEWSCDNYQVAEVTNGIVKCKTNGTANITATLQNGASDTIRITVTDTSLKMNSGKYDIAPCYPYTVSARLSSSEYSPEDIVWSVGDSDLATVTGKGYARLNDGTYELYAEVNAKSVGKTLVFAQISGHERLRTSAVIEISNKLMITTENEKDKDYIACKIKEDTNKTYILASFTDFDAEKSDYEWKIISNGGQASFGEIMFLQNPDRNSGLAGLMMAELIGISKGEIEIKVVSLKDGMEDSRKVMVQEPLKIISSTISDGETNVSLRGGYLLGQQDDINFYGYLPLDLEFNEKVVYGTAASDTPARLQDISDHSNNVYSPIDVEEKTITLSFASMPDMTLESNKNYRLIIEKDAIKPENEDEIHTDDIDWEELLSFTTEPAGLAYFKEMPNFTNSPTAFFNSDEEHRYFISDMTRLNEIFKNSGASYSLKTKIKNTIRKDEWTGSCFGISMTTALVKNKTLTAGDIHSGTETLYKLPKPKDSTAVRDFINTYQQTQHLFEPEVIGYGSGALAQQNSVQDALRAIVARASRLTADDSFILGLKTTDICHALLVHRFKNYDNYYELEIYDTRTINSSTPLAMRISKDYSSCEFGTDINSQTNKLDGMPEYNAEITSISYYEPAKIYNGSVSKASLTVSTNAPYTINVNGASIVFDGNSFGGDLSKAISVRPILNNSDTTSYVVTFDSLKDVSITAKDADISVSAVTDSMYADVTASGVNEIIINGNSESLEVSGNNMQYTVTKSSHGSDYDIAEISGQGSSVNVYTENNCIKAKGDGMESLTLTSFNDSGYTETTSTIPDNNIVIGTDGSIAQNKYPVTVTTSKQITDDSYIISLQFNQIISDMIVYTAAYSADDKLLFVESVDIANPQITVPKNPDVSYFKTFVWNKNMTPLSNTSCLINE